jgi:glucose-1-phosphate thymidylyltransferase
MKGLILAGGTGSRLYPLSLVTNKHLLPVYDRPMIYYPIETLQGMGIRDILVILGGRSIGDIVELLADGAHFGVNLTYRYQRGAPGIAHAIGLGRDFVGEGSFCVVLGDNILQGAPLASIADEFDAGPFDAGVLLSRVDHPENFGVAELDANGELVAFAEKPAVPKGNHVAIGVYFFRASAFEVIAALKPSDRGELEITDCLNAFLARGRLFWREYDGRWSDAGTVEALTQASMLAAENAQKGTQPP